MAKHKRSQIRSPKPARPGIALEPEVGRLNYKAVAEDRRKSRERDESMLRRGSVTREELQRRNSMIPPGTKIRILTLPAYCIEPD